MTPILSGVVSTLLATTGLLGVAGVCRWLIHQAEW